MRSAEQSEMTFRFRFLTRADVSDTASHRCHPLTLNHRAPGSSPGAPTIQSSRTAETVDEKRPFLRGSCHLFSTFPVSADNYGLSGGFSASSLCIQKFRSWRLEFRTATNQPVV